jgi:hypothetical protein
VNWRELLPFPGRGWPGVVIAIVVAIQLTAPLDYYVWRTDPHDERFAWRMFSPVRMISCEPTFLVDRAPVRLGATFHEGWIEIAKRGRFRVLEAMGAKLCRANPGKEVRLDLQCKTLGGGKESWGGADLCQYPEI